MSVIGPEPGQEGDSGPPAAAEYLQMVLPSPVTSKNQAVENRRDDEASRTSGPLLEFQKIQIILKIRIYSLHRFYEKLMSSLNAFWFCSFEFERNTLEYLENLIHPEDRKANKLKKELYHSEWRDKLIALQPSDNTLWDTAKRMPKKHTKISALNGPTSTAFSNIDKAEIVADSLQNQFTLNKLIDTATENLVIHTINEFNKIDNFPPMPNPKPNDIIKYIRNVNIHKAPGSDGITNNMLRNLPIITLIKIIHIINNIFKHQYFPISWRVAIAVPILKPGEDPTDPTIYGPISLLPTITKVTEHFFFIQLNDYLNDNNILIPYKFGFKPKLSTTHQLIRAVEFITSGFENRFSTGAVFLDIQ
ncbi:putative RNA-directed DNA polymerase from transposon X-element [Araneus ventricosus]|uniref:Putative RNA-directed DNA polymerase from transposon X-element n=1 Tax=Araneus ventricosus TaxID=182803 RepID=A0A4Y2F6Z7_ARAVE|nr:putative RNA-directed DNA polymerase from transposon X-element [Araneus ventricosus]